MSPCSTRHPDQFLTFGNSHYSIGHVRLKPSEQIGSHQQPTWELSLVIEGEGTRTIADVNEPFKSGEVVLVPPETVHCWHFTDNVEKI